LAAKTEEDESESHKEAEKGFNKHTRPVYCGSLPVVQRTCFFPLLIGYGIYRVAIPLSAMAQAWFQGLQGVSMSDTSGAHRTIRTVSS
jgi:hypothetical protein